VTALIWLALIAQVTQTAVSPSVYVPERVYDTRRQAFSDFEVMLADLARADIVFVGEQHDDSNTHRLEAAILDGLRRRGAEVTLSLEMFERDVQPALDEYLAGKMPEDALLKTARPWPRYATDYRALVEMARAEQWPVVAANVPRRLAAEAAKSGKPGIDGLSPDDRALVGGNLQCPLDAYFERFSQSMGSHPASGTEKTSSGERKATAERYYFSQCVKDETMAESIAGALERSTRRPIVHVNGAFHSDFGQGTVERTRRRAEGRRIVVVSIVPVKDIDAAAPSAEDLRRADYLLYTTK